MSFGGINGAGPQGAPVFGNQGPAAAPVAAGAVQGQAGAPANGATPFFNTSFESIMCAMSRGEIPANLGVNNAPGLGPQVPLLQAVSQSVPQNGANGIGVTSGYQPGVGANAPAVTSSFGGTQYDAKQMASTIGATNQYNGN